MEYYCIKQKKYLHVLLKAWYLMDKNKDAIIFFLLIQFLFCLHYFQSTNKIHIFSILIVNTVNLELYILGRTKSEKQ